MPSEQPRVEASFQLELADTLAASRFLLRRSPLRWALPLALPVLAANAVASGSWSVAVSILVGIAVTAFMLLLFLPRRAFRANPNARATQTWVLSADGIACEVTAADGGTLARSEVLWRSVLRAHESRQAFLLSSTTRAFFVLPKRALDPDMLADVRALLAANVASPTR
jgi:hypothetical protein